MKTVVSITLISFYQIIVKNRLSNCGSLFCSRKYQVSCVNLVILPAKDIMCRASMPNKLLSPFFEHIQMNSEYTWNRGAALSNDFQVFSE